jgi:hypothetical protein
MMTIVEMALQEAALRLAWYTRAHGGIPAAEAIKLQLSASGVRRDDIGAGKPRAAQAPARTSIHTNE